MGWESGIWSILAWVVVWGFWLGVTHDHHPTFALAVIVTTSLIVAYALAVYVNQLVLIPRYWKAGHRLLFVLWLALAMAFLTGVALVIIRISYLKLWGPDSDPVGVYKNYLIDLFGMPVHLLAAAGIVSLFQRARRGSSIDRH